MGGPERTFQNSKGKGEALLFWSLRQGLRAQGERSAGFWTLPVAHTLRLASGALAPLFLDQSFQAELFGPVADLPQGQAQVQSGLGLNPVVALQGGHDQPVLP